MTFTFILQCFLAALGIIYSIARTIFVLGEIGTPDVMSGALRLVFFLSSWIWGFFSFIFSSFSNSQAKASFWLQPYFIWPLVIVITAGLYWFLRNQQSSLRWILLVIGIYPALLGCVHIAGIRISSPGDRFANSPNPLYAAVMYRDRDAIHDLIANGKLADLNGKDDQEPPFLTAVSTDQLEIAEDLVQAGADIFLSDKMGFTGGGFLKNSRISSIGPEGQARMRLLKLHLDKGFPLQDCDPDNVESLIKQRQWPLRPTQAKASLTLQQAEKIAASEFSNRTENSRIDRSRTRSERYGYIFWGNREKSNPYENERPFYAVLIEIKTGSKFILGDAKTIDTELNAFEKLWQQYLQ